MDWSATEFLNSISPLQIVILACFIFLFVSRFTYDLIIAFGLILKKEKESSPGEGKVSFLMAIRNEEDSLKTNLPPLLNLPDPKFEVIVVDDFSQDQSLTVLGLMKEKNNNLKFSSLSQDARFSTKLALNIAIKASEGEWAMVLAPTAKGYNEEWISSIRNKIGGETKAVIGYLGLAPQKGLFNLLSRIELFFQQLKSFTFSSMGTCYVVNELNILFESKQYFEQGGFKGEMSEEYANMELLINKFITKKNVAINFSEKGKIIDNVEVDKNYFVELRTKHKHIVRKLRVAKRLIYGVNESTKFLYPLFFVCALLFIPKLFMLIGIIGGIKIALHVLILLGALKRLNEQKIFISSLLYELVAPYFQVLARAMYYLSFKRKWSP